MTTPHAHDGPFVETGQTFAEDGAAYCPIERRRRGVGAVIASTSVLLLGTAFLAFATLTSPQKIAEVVEAAPSVDIIAATERAPAPPPVAAPETDKPISVAEAIAESRAARAGLPETADEPGLAPRLKPTLSADAEPASSDEAQPAPTLKLEAAASVASAPAPAVSTLNSFEAAPNQTTPFFFAGDLERRIIDRTPPAVAFARDITPPASQRTLTITRGENFVDLLRRAGVNAIDRNSAAYAFGQHYNLRQLRPGQAFTLTIGYPNETLFEAAARAKGDEPEARLLALDFREDAETRITLRRDGDGFAGAEETVPLTTRMMAINGRIDGSLYLSAKAAGAPDMVIAELADAFAYDVDFQREIFGGDEFEALFEVRYDDKGEIVSAGDIVFARLNWRGRQREKGYYRFAGAEDDERGDFYDAAGQGAKRLLMKTPIDGARLSSGFGRRKHPILGYARAHKGVDFAANRGTPIKAAGDGVVERADRYGSFGNYVRIRHANGYQTAYAHLNGFARGMRKGKRVRQGDIIGYVGTTGRSTGPHLHYEVHLNGQAVNPQNLKIATGKQLKGADLARFETARERIDAMRLPPDETASLISSGAAGEGKAAP